MFDLATIKSMNDRACNVRQGEDNFSRECSFSGDSKTGVVLHSALRRNTAFLRPGRQAAAFLARWWSVNSQEARNRIVESYFQ